MLTEKSFRMFDIGDILTFYNLKKLEIQQKLLSFKNVTGLDIFYELCYCLLTPANKAQNALIVVEFLKNEKFFEKGFDPTEILRGAVFSGNSHKIYIRFHNQKAKRLLLARENWKEIEVVLKQELDVVQKREVLVQTVYGFGYKEASHFLRNIGYEGIAILDRHILKNLVQFGVLDKIPNIGNRENYLNIEKIYFEFAKKLGISPEELDLLLWAKETGEVLK